MLALAACRGAGAPAAATALWNDATERFEVAAFDAAGTRLDPGGWGLEAQAAAALDGRGPSSPPRAADGWSVATTAPLRHRGRKLGALFVLAGGPGGVTPADPEALATLAPAAAVAVRNARLVASLQQLGEFRSAMLQMAAHDLRGPLTRAVAYLELLEDEVDLSEARHQAWVTEIHQAFRRMEALINGVLDYERVVGIDRTRRGPQDLAALAADVVAELAPEAAAQRQDLALAPPEGELRVNGDQVLLREAVWNLVDNAVRHAGEGTTIRVRVRRQGTDVALEVADDGRGIAPAYHDVVFQPFTRLDPRDEQGTGLGLSLVRRIAEVHGGRVELESAAGEGARFTLLLPGD